MKFSLVAAMLALGVAVWVFAAVGILTVVRGITAEVPPPPQAGSLLNPSAEDVAGSDLRALDRYPGSVRAEYRNTVWADAVVTKVEYRTPASVAEVRTFYEGVFEAWIVVGRDQSRGEWEYRLVHGEREAVVEIERQGGVTEIEIELLEPVIPRGDNTGR